eukprot:1271736-Rhodomonas_salina.2
MKFVDSRVSQRGGRDQNQSILRDSSRQGTHLSAEYWDFISHHIGSSVSSAISRDRGFVRRAGL